MDIKSTERNYNLVDKMNCEFHLTSAAEGVNIVRVSKIYIYILQIFEDIISKAFEYKNNPEKGYFDKMLNLLGDENLFKK